MNGILKAAHVEKQAANENELRLINKQTLRELTAEEVFTFRLAACDNQVDRDYERFTDKALEGLAPLFVGMLPTRRPGSTPLTWKPGARSSSWFCGAICPGARLRREPFLPLNPAF